MHGGLGLGSRLCLMDSCADNGEPRSCDSSIFHPACDRRVHIGRIYVKVMADSIDDVSPEALYVDHSKHDSVSTADDSRTISIGFRPRTKTHENRTIIETFMYIDIYNML